jgi:hypothetical protein
LHRRFGPAVLLLISLSAAVCLGDGYGYQGYQGYQGPFQHHHHPTSQNSSFDSLTIGQNAAPAPAVTAAQVQQDETAVTTAKAIFLNDKEDLKAIEAKYRKPFEQSQPWIDAQANLTQAQADLQTAKQTVLANLASDPAYSAAVAAKQKADADLFQARASGETSPDDLGPLAFAAMNANAQVGKMEDAAEAADPGVIAASQKISDAQAAIDQLNTQYQQTLQSNLDWTTAHAKAEASGKTLADARAKLASDVNLLPAGAVRAPAIAAPAPNPPAP